MCMECGSVLLNSRALARLFRQQVLYIALSAVIGAIFWANGQQVNPATIVLYSLLLGNLATPAMERLHFLYSNRPFPYNWIIFLLLLAPLAALVYLVASAVVWWIAPPSPQTFSHLVTTGWKFPILVLVVLSTITFLYRNSKERLERRNIELEQSVERETAQLEMHEQEFQRAREIQQSLLPREIPQISGFTVAGAWQPARTVSGDYYDVLRLGDHRLGICIADVVGKGVSAALLMANVQAAVRAFANNSESPAGVCAKVNRLLHENIATGKFVTFLYGILDGESRTFRYCNAGHLYPILVSGGSVRMPEEGGAVLGVFSDWTYEDSSMELRAGDRLILFTDGITEAADEEQREFGESGIAEFAKANSALSASELTSQLLGKVTEFCAAQFRDDATLLVIAAN